MNMEVKQEEKQVEWKAVKSEIGKRPEKDKKEEKDWSAVNEKE